MPVSRLLVGCSVAFLLAASLPYKYDGVYRDESGLPATWITFDVARTLKGESATTLTIKQSVLAEEAARGSVPPKSNPRRSGNCKQLGTRICSSV